MPNPLILTLNVNHEASEYFTKLRKMHFPVEINYLDAHLTLFHNLPHEEKILQYLEEVILAQSKFNMEVTGIVLTGNGVAFKIESAILQDLHKSMQQEWQSYLIPQDRQKLWPHITIQNKVSPNVAQALRQELSETFQPFMITAQGLTLWEYLSGPWKFYRQVKF